MKGEAREMHLKHCRCVSVHEHDRTESMHLLNDLICVLFEPVTIEKQTCDSHTHTQGKREREKEAHKSPVE